jgi:hypothetical protein
MKYDDKTPIIKIDSVELISFMDSLINACVYRKNRWGMNNDFEKGMRSGLEDVYQFIKNKEIEGCENEKDSD